MIEACDCFGFPPKTDEGFVRVYLMSKDAFHRNNPA
jgi:hypothetical protein